MLELLLELRDFSLLLLCHHVTFMPNLATHDPARTEEGFEKVQAAAREAKEQARGEAYNQPDLRTGNEM